MNDAELDLAHAYALGILDDDERSAVDALQTSANRLLRREFDDAVRQARETLATVALVSVASPPPRILERVLAQILDEQNDDGAVAPLATLPDRLAAKRAATTRWKWALGAAAAIAVLAGGTVIGVQLRETNGTSVAESVIAAPDLQTARIVLADGGTATALYSKEADAAIVMMVDVPAPAADSVYQMWLIRDAGAAESAGIMAEVTPTTTAVVNDLDGATSLAFSVEPAGGSEQPTTTPFAKLDLA